MNSDQQEGGGQCSPRSMFPPNPLVPVFPPSVPCVAASRGRISTASIIEFVAWSFVGTISPLSKALRIILTPMNEGQPDLSESLGSEVHNDEDGAAHEQHEVEPHGHDYDSGGAGAESGNAGEGDVEQHDEGSSGDAQPGTDKGKDKQKDKPGAPDPKDDNTAPDDAGTPIGPMS